MSSRRVEIHVVPTPGARINSTAVIIFCSSYARPMSTDNTSYREATRKRPALLVSSIPSTSTLGANCTSSSEQCGRYRVERASLKRKILSRNGSCIGFSNRTNDREDRQSINLERDESLDKALRGAADASTYTNEFVLSLWSICDQFLQAQFQRPNTFHDLHLSGGKNMDADPMRELRNSHVPVLDPIALVFSFSHDHEWRGVSATGH